MWLSHESLHVIKFKYLYTHILPKMTQKYPAGPSNAKLARNGKGRGFISLEAGMETQPNSPVWLSSELA